MAAAAAYAPGSGFATSADPPDAPPRAAGAAAAAAFELHSRVVTVTSVPTEMIWAPASTPHAALQVVVIPGNPGSCRFYTAFMEELYSRFGGAADVLAVSHAGHEQGSPGDKLWTLDCQIRHKADFLQQHVLLPGRPPAVLVTHSIGCYMALHALRELEDARGAPAVVKIVLCKPFLRTNPACYRQAAIRAAAARAPLVAAAAGRLGAAPERLKALLMRVFAPAVEEHARPALTGLLGRGSVHNNLHLAHHEFIDLNQELDWDLVRRLGPRVAVIAAPRDMWFPRSHFDEMLSEVPGLTAYWEEDLTHAFCVSLHQCRKVAALVHEVVQRRLAAAAADAAGEGGSAGAAEAAAAAAAGAAAEAELAGHLAEARPRL